MKLTPVHGDSRQRSALLCSAPPTVPCPQQRALDEFKSAVNDRHACELSGRGQR